MHDNFTQCLKLLAISEGDVSDHPDDPGGLTKGGVTQETYDSFRKNKGLPLRAVTKSTKAERTQIFKEQFWDPIRGDDLPLGIDYAVFDYTVNSGSVQAAKDLQRVVGTTVDGKIGLNTLAAVVKKCQESPVSDELIVNALCDRRLAFVKKLKNWGTFKNGWTARIAAVRAAGVDMARKMDATVPPPVAPTPKAEPTNVAVTKTAGGKAGIVGVGGVCAAVSGTVGPVLDGVKATSDKGTQAAQSIKAAIPTFMGLPVQLYILLGLVACLGAIAFLVWRVWQLQKGNG